MIKYCELFKDFIKNAIDCLYIVHPHARCNKPNIKSDSIVHFSPLDIANKDFIYFLLRKHNIHNRLKRHTKVNNLIFKQFLNNSHTIKNRNIFSFLFTTQKLSFIFFQSIIFFLSHSFQFSAFHGSVKLFQ